MLDWSLVHILPSLEFILFLLNCCFVLISRYLNEYSFLNLSCVEVTAFNFAYSNFLFRISPYFFTWRFFVFFKSPWKGANAYSKTFGSVHFCFWLMRFCEMNIAVILVLCAQVYSNIPSQSKQVSFPSSLGQKVAFYQNEKKNLVCLFAATELLS